MMLKRETFNFFFLFSAFAGFILSFETIYLVGALLCFFFSFFFLFFLFPFCSVV